MPTVSIRDRSRLELHPASSDANPFLSANFAPVGTERAVRGPFPMIGHLPPELDGFLLRNGPNPATVADHAAHEWCTGDGMVHAIELRSGQAVGYRNRWVRTRALADQLATPAPAGLIEPVDSPANAGVVCHAGRLLALAERGLPFRLRSDLRTVGLEDFDGMVSSPVSPLPKIDPATGGMVMFGYDCFGPPYLRYHELDAGGSVVHSTGIDIPRPTVQHDFAVTPSRVVFLDLPAVFDPEMARRGTPLPFRWDPEAGARLGVLRRGEDGAATRWFALEPRFAFHVMNARDAGERIVIEACRHDEAFGPIAHTTAVLERWEIDPLGGVVRVTQLDDLAVEWPRVDDRLTGRPYRFGYCVATSGAHGLDGSSGLVRYDLQNDRRAVWDPGEDWSAGEPVFVRASGARSDDEGWVLSIVSDLAGTRSCLAVLDGSSFGGDPVALVDLPFRIPHGCHGTWVPREELAAVR